MWLSKQANKRQIALLVSLLGIWVGLVAYAGWRQFARDPDPSEQVTKDPETVRLLWPQEPITEVPVRPVRVAWDALTPSEMVLGIVVNGEARAYPLDVLNDRPDRKVQNDTLGGQAVAVTF
jgi:hypothetical protein